ncbi:pentatricopeptide repeat-containing protein At1g62350-like [Euphorbia lathyris]|uniref:pentatricopeptide repeat-containing protein At1g62350-like n=1 Tax=Euphorbia lathyris TaxID=212925 RepID=UPI00331316E1
MATSMDSLKFQFSQLKFCEFSKKSDFRKSIITCSLRGGPRKPLWKAKRLSTEAIQAIQSLKLAKSSNLRLEQVFNGKVSRLLKADLIATLEVLQNQNELELALKVFEFVQKEIWYKPDVSLYYGMIQMLGRNKLIEMTEEFLCKLEEEGLKPDTRVFTEIIGAYLNAGVVEKAMETYGRMKESGCKPDKLTFTILIRNLEEAGRDELAASVKNECGVYMDYPEEFLKELVQKKNAKRQTIKLV